MINPEVKSRINKIDFELKQVFENVFIKEKYYGDIGIDKSNT